MSVTGGPRGVKRCCRPPRSARPGCLEPGWSWQGSPGVPGVLRGAAGRPAALAQGARSPAGAGGGPHCVTGGPWGVTGCCRPPHSARQVCPEPGWSWQGCPLCRRGSPRCYGVLSATPQHSPRMLGAQLELVGLPVVSPGVPEVVWGAMSHPVALAESSRGRLQHLWSWQGVPDTSWGTPKMSERVPGVSGVSRGVPNVTGTTDTLCCAGHTPWHASPTCHGVSPTRRGVSQEVLTGQGLSPPHQECPQHMTGCPQCVGGSRGRPRPPLSPTLSLCLSWCPLQPWGSLGSLSPLPWGGPCVPP